MSLNPLPLDIWYEILLLLDIQEANSISKAYPRFFGAFIESKQAIRFNNAINSYRRSNAVDLPVGPLASFVCYLSRDSSMQFSSLISWLARRFKPFLSSSIVVNRKLYEDLSSVIALKDRGFVSVSSTLSSWNVELKTGDDSSYSVSWILLYRASLSGYRALDFHRACDGMGKCVVVVKAENGRIAVAYNENGFTSDFSRSPNLNGFIASVDEDSGCGEIFHRNDQEKGIDNRSGVGPDFGCISASDLLVSNNCRNDYSFSNLGFAYGGPGVNQRALFGQMYFRVVDYEVFKIVVE
jgi:hypothetical protein